MNECFPRLLRILKGSEYQRVFQKKVYIHSRYFVIYHTLSESEHSRVGVIISRKALRYAVWRNRCKRLVRETFRTHAVRMAGIDIVLVGKRALKEATNAEIVYCLNKLFTHIGKKT